jgi:hypothetical protein
MAKANDKSVSTKNGDAEAIRHLKEAIAGGRHWYLALLEAMGRWASAEESYQDRTYRYLIDGEAFDWLLLAERLCGAVEGLPEDETSALLFGGRPPLNLSAGEVRELIGQGKYGHYLNYFYGITVEEALMLAVQEEIEKEKRVLGYRSQRDYTEEAYQRIYDAPRAELLRQFRQEKGYPKSVSTTLTEMKEFTYWLFKYRLKHCEKARMASDTKKALQFLRRQWQQKGIFGVLTAENN